MITPLIEMLENDPSEASAVETQSQKSSGFNNNHNHGKENIEPTLQSPALPSPLIAKRLSNSHPTSWYSGTQNRKDKKDLLLDTVINLSNMVAKLNLKRRKEKRKKRKKRMKKTLKFK